MTYFNQASNVTINGGTFTSIGQPGIDRLVNAVSPNAMHNSSTRYGPPRCHEGTRMAILERIMQWVFGSDDRDALILWIYGPAGAGKSAILQSIAENCAAFNILLASFFFSRFHGTRNHADSLVATIAYQISTRIPQITAALDAAIVRDPMIFNRTLDAQIDVLIAQPLRDLIQSGFFADPTSAPRLILIDGLDECNNKGQRAAILHAISRAIQAHGLPFLFLISSRPETDIFCSIDSAELAGSWNLVLDDDYINNQGICLFLHDSLRSIKEKHPMKGYIPPLWPDQSAFDTLVSKSSGQYIYPSTVIKYISNICASPVKQLDIILGLRPARMEDSPFAELDALYMHILSSVEDMALMLDILAILMGYFMSARLRQSLHISNFLCVDQDEVEGIIFQLASITSIDEHRIRVTHASLEDFLADPKRSGSFYIDKAQYTEKLARHGIRWILRNLEPNAPSRVNPFHLFNEGNIMDGIFSEENSLQMSQVLYQDLKSLPLALMWDKWDKAHDCHNYLSLFPEWVSDIYAGLMYDGKLQRDSTSQVGTWCKELLIKYAKCLKPLSIARAKKENMHIPFLLIFEILVHDFRKDNGEGYDPSYLFYHSACHTYEWDQFEELRYEGAGCDMIFQYGGLSNINRRRNPYIHAAIRIIKALAIVPIENAYPSRQKQYIFRGIKRWTMLGIGFRFTKILLKKEELERTRPYRPKPQLLLWWLRSDSSPVLSKFIHKSRRHNINSGKIYRIQRNIRLTKFQPDSCNTNHFNRHLVFDFLIPILDQCPKSDELLALIKHRMRHALLRYMTRRHLTDAVDRYIRRTSGITEI